MSEWKPRFSGFERKVRASFARQSLMATFGAEVSSVSPGAVELRAPIGEAVRQQRDYAHGGFLFSLGDTAAGYAALSLQDEASEVLTVEMKVNFLAAAQGTGAIARGRVLRAGRSLVVVAADVFAATPTGDETHVAALQGTMKVTSG